MFGQEGKVDCTFFVPKINGKVEEIPVQTFSPEERQNIGTARLEASGTLLVAGSCTKSNTETGEQTGCATLIIVYDKWDIVTIYEAPIQQHEGGIRSMKEFEESGKPEGGTGVFGLHHV